MKTRYWVYNTTTGLVRLVLDEPTDSSAKAYEAAEKLRRITPVEMPVADHLMPLKSPLIWGMRMMSLREVYDYLNPSH